MRRRRWVRKVGAVFGTVALGALLGFLIPTVIAEFFPREEPQTSVVPSMTADMELPIARQFITAFLENNQPLLRQLGATEIDTVKASDLAIQTQKVGPPVLLGALGANGSSIQAYAADVVLNDGTTNVMSWRVVTISGQPSLIMTAPPADPTP